ncbi:FecR family protein [Mucilaginibacter yixingensis]|uniref:FecR family protein n=2 Tax=Mucilaginibacter yixingensis TaxID=1295612 RepID=A0A2T5JGA3_9SPHI|nr:FecR family protein [Mucilaginibacter yixingensis]
MTEELIKKYFLQECTSDERAAVSAWFDAHPEELDRYLDDDSWLRFEAQQTVQPHLAEQMLQQIEAHIAKTEAELKPIRSVSYSRWAIAASVILAVSAGLFFLLRGQKSNNANQMALAQPSAAAMVDDTVGNTTGNIKIVTLSDGSIVSLSPQSQIIFHKDFVQPHRDIRLTGEAMFKVAKDKTRPFTVYAGSLSTTALGTRFKVTAFTKGEIKVMLYTGKVVIKQHDSAQQMPDVYLTPGMQLAWRSKDNRPEVSNFTPEAGSSALANNNRTIIKGQTITFNNESLTQVIATLKHAYGVVIEADEALLNNSYYTGTVNLQKDEAEDILTTIAGLNKLKLVHKNDAYLLTR